VSPDSSWVVYAHSNLDSRYGPGDLYLSSATTPGTEVRLDALDGTAYNFGAGSRDRDLNYEPTFMPVAAGGYFWVVFTSRRTLGNQLTGDTTQVKQLWVAAVDLQPTPGVDPSHPAFWVPGQSLENLNMRGFWALDPCLDDGKACGQGSQCCSQTCNASGTCGQPAGQTCQPVGATCATASDCCYFKEGFLCINSHCTESKP
jgi:hypothetical protein